jgi:hypothetical protein
MLDLNLKTLSKGCILFTIKELQAKAVSLSKDYNEYNLDKVHDITHLQIRVGRIADNDSKLQELKRHLKAINIAISLLRNELKTRTRGKYHE